MAAAHLFDDPPLREATERFLAEQTHHLLIAYEDGVPAGMVTGVEMTHPDKGTEMFLYELSVHPAHRKRGMGTALVAALAELARARGCYGMWAGTEPDNAAALATYRAAGAAPPEECVTLSWSFAESPPAPPAIEQG